MKNFDVVIIGAGIGGLVCGNYLAKSGLRTLIVEKHYAVGGYCSSFDRFGYTFDVGVHSVGGLKQGVLRNIFDELELYERFDFSRREVAEKICMPKQEVLICADWKDTLADFQKKFPDEKENLKSFFRFLLNDNFLEIYKKTKSITLNELLEEFFENRELMAVMSAITLGNAGLSGDKVSALFTAILFRQSVFDPGYRPKNGINTIPEVLAEEFEKNGGELSLSTKIERISTQGGRVRSVETSEGQEIMTNFVVSNGDATETFDKLLDVDTEEKNKVKLLLPSSSIFALYVGINNTHDFIDTWKFSTYELARDDGTCKEADWFLCASSMPEKSQEKKSAFCVFTKVPYKGETFWDKERAGFCERLFQKAVKTFDFFKDVDVCFDATPLTYEKFTSNRKGAAFGWAAVPEQVKMSVFPQTTSVEGLFLAGHWTTIGSAESGVPGVALLGRRAAEIVLKKNKKEWSYKRITL